LHLLKSSHEILKTKNSKDLTVYSKSSNAIPSQISLGKNEKTIIIKNKKC